MNENDDDEKFFFKVKHITFHITRVRKILHSKNCLAADINFDK